MRRLLLAISTSALLLALSPPAFAASPFRDGSFGKSQADKADTSSSGRSERSGFNRGPRELKSVGDDAKSGDRRSFGGGDHIKSNASENKGSNLGSHSDKRDLTGATQDKREWRERRNDSTKTDRVNANDQRGWGDRKRDNDNKADRLNVRDRRDGRDRNDGNNARDNRGRSDKNNKWDRNDKNDKWN